MINFRKCLNPRCVAWFIYVVFVSHTQIAKGAVTIGDLSISVRENAACNFESGVVYAAGQQVNIVGSGFAANVEVNINLVARIDGTANNIPIISAQTNDQGALDVTTIIVGSYGGVGLLKASGTSGNGDARLLQSPLILVESATLDDDNDGTPNICDLCPAVASNEQSDTDEDGVGDICDAFPLDPYNDADGDGISAELDVCPFDRANDEDGDGVCGRFDNCPFVANSDQLDSDHDGIGDACLDGIYANAGPDRAALAGTRVTLSGSLSRPQPLFYSWYQVTGTSVSLDSSSAEYPHFDAPNVQIETVLEFGLVVSDGLNDSLPDTVEVTILPDIPIDSDDDGIADSLDNCPLLPNPSQEDVDGDGIGDACAPISDLTGRAKDRKVSLVWTPIAASAGYNIYRRDGGAGSFELIAENHQTDYATYLDTGLVNGVPYEYMVRWLATSLNEMSDSNVASVTPKRRIGGCGASCHSPRTGFSSGVSLRN